jgi:hypothetical protein
MVAIIEQRYNEVTLKNNNCQKSFIKIDVLMKSVYNNIHYANMRDDMAYLSL